ncbi:MAG: endopeptidase La [Acidimicrobiales bacterium]
MADPHELTDTADRPLRSSLTLPVLPLAGGVVLPQMVVTIALETDEARAAAAAVGDDRLLLLVPNPDGRYATVGVIARVEDDGALPNGTPALVVRAEHRARLGAGVVGTGAALWLRAEAIDEPAPSERARQLAAEYKAAARSLLEHLGGRRLAGMLRDLDDPAALADSAGWWPDLSLERKVELLETVDVEDRLGKVLAWAKEALAEAELSERIRTEVAEGMERQQREFLLRQQLAAIRKELGEGDDEADVAQAFRDKIADRDLPASVRTAVEREIDRLERTSPQNVEHGWIRTWLDTVTDVPWGERTTDDLDLVHARAVLDADHTGLDEVKDRIVEELAVRKLRAERTGGAPARDETDPTPPGSPSPTAGGVPARAEIRPVPTIVALVGPPGVGKTSLGASVARALGRRFVRVALGGVRDEAEIRGHRRTYVGAREGRIAKALVEAGTMNPVFLLDEIDKVGADWRGDPSAALLEVLDPAQNHTFRDHYLEVDVDLSEVLFIATANVLETIPGPLLDRMEVIRIDGYTDAEKVAIARDHLLPRLRQRMGLRDDEVSVTDDALASLASEHTREAGVRNLERQLGKVLRKAATAVAARRDQEEGPATAPVVIGPEQLRAALGRPRFRHDEANRHPQVGVVNGLAVTGAGGDVLVVEATAMDGEGGEVGSLVLTGQLGDVMNESGQIALSHIRAGRERLGIAPDAFRRRFHVHFPAGAVPKDGPSAGVTMTTALVSLLTDRPVVPTVGMTGEVTLQGKVLPIGGVKQKLLAAHRAGLTDVVIPAANEADLEDLPADVLAALRVHLVDHVDEVLAVALAPAPARPDAAAA